MIAALSDTGMGTGAPFTIWFLLVFVLIVLGSIVWGDR